MKVLELLTASMQRLGYLEATETPEDADAQACLQAANDWIDALALEEMFLYRIRRHTFNLVANTGSYSIGTGATFNVARPVSIERCGVIPDPAASPAQELPLGPPLTVQEYASVRTKAATASRPGAVYYDPGMDASGYGTIYVLPVPDSSTPDLVLYLPERISEFAELDDDVILPAGYRRFFVHNIAVEIAPILGAIVSPDLRAVAMEAKAAIQRANVRPEDLALGLDVPGVAGGGRYDINLG